MVDSYVGEIRPFAGDYAPQDWALCDGSLLQITDYQALYSLLGTTFGGDGSTNFALPNLKGRVPIGAGTGTGLTARALGQTGGSEMVALTPTNIPAHTHAFTVSTDAATQHSPANNMLANPAPRLFYATTATAGSPSQVLNEDSINLSYGGDVAHENRMPTMAINYIISLMGMYPEHP